MKTAKDHYIEILQMASDEKLPTTLFIEDGSDDNKYSPYIIELVKGGYIDGRCEYTTKGRLILGTFISSKGREYLEQLKAEKPWEKFKAKGLENLWIALTSCVTAILTTLLTLWLFKGKP